MAKRSIHWVAPAIMVSMLLAGVLFAIGHHLFYASLASQAVSTSSYNIAGRSLPEQQFNIAVGTAFAFLVKICLGLAMSTGYVQLFWWHARTIRDQPTVAEMDWAQALISNALLLLNVKSSWKYPVLFLLGVFYWTIPIATIFPPATLSVAIASSAPLSPLQVPQVDFANFKFTAGLFSESLFGAHVNDTRIDRYHYLAPSIPTQQLAQASLGRSDIPHVASPNGNTSWALQFWGPGLQCQDVRDEKRIHILANIWNSYSQYVAALNLPVAYLSWTPWSWINEERGKSNQSIYDLPQNRSRSFDPDLPFLINTTGPDGTFYSAFGPSNASTSTEGPASVFVAILPPPNELGLKYANTSGSNSSNSILMDVFLTGGGAAHSNCHYRMVNDLDESISCDKGDTITPATLFSNVTLVRCDMVNTTYDISIDNHNNQQVVNVSVAPADTSMAVNTSHFYDAAWTRTFPNGSARDSCSSFIRPDVIELLPGPTGLYWNLNGSVPCVFDTGALRQLSYQSIMAAFNSFLIGHMRGSSSEGYILESTTSIMNTILGLSREFSFLSFTPETSFWTLQNVMTRAIYNNTVDASVVADPASVVNITLRDNIEQAFQRYIAGLLTEDYFLPNYTSPYAPSRLTNVSVQSYSNVYAYNRSTLWLAYGIEITLTTLVVIAGFVALIVNGASYTDQFSTIARITRGAHFKPDIANKDTTGSDPLPKRLGKAHVSFDSLSNSDHHSENMELHPVPSVRAQGNAQSAGPVADRDEPIPSEDNAVEAQGVVGPLLEEERRVSDAIGASPSETSAQPRASTDVEGASLMEAAQESTPHARGT